MSARCEVNILTFFSEQCSNALQKSVSQFISHITPHIKLPVYARASCWNVSGVLMLVRHDFINFMQIASYKTNAEAGCHFRHFLSSRLIHCVKSARIRNFSGPYFPTFGLNTERPRVSPYSVRMRENTAQKYSEYEHFSRSNKLPNKKTRYKRFLLKFLQIDAILKMLKVLEKKHHVCFGSKEDHETLLTTF